MFMECSWNVHGIEIADLLHCKGREYITSAMQQGLFTEDVADCESDNSIALHLGPTEDFPNLLRDADILFAYSTAFSARNYSPEISALILDPEWSEVLSQCCSSGCIAITTDRALDPAHGWKLLDRLDVDNPEVFGTTGYIQVLA